MKGKLELRMYGLVPYNISPIQQAIQFGHAVVEHGQLSKKVGGERLETYNNWADNWKTFIILNGGTTNNRIIDGIYFGTLNQHREELDKNGIDIALFNEPDLGDQLTAITFIVDERVFNKKDYLEFGDWLMENYTLDYLNIDKSMNLLTTYTIGEAIKASENDIHKEVYGEWIEYIGGKKNLFLREFLKNFRLA